MGEEVGSKNIIPTTFSEGVIWNYVSLFFVAVVWLFLNLLIGKFYGAECLGVFTQSYAIYVMCAQFSVFGIQLSVLRYTSGFSGDDNCDEMMSSALLITAIFSIIAILLVNLCLDIISEVLDSPDIRRSLMFVLPGLFFFSINKVLLSFLNGLGKMKQFASAQAARAFLILLTAMWFYLEDFPGQIFSVILAISEFGLSLGLLAYCSRLFKFNLRYKSFYWIMRHLRFGGKGVVGGVIIEVNTRVDVLMLGIFLSDRMVGIYSLAAYILEGVSQLAHVLRININPYIGQLFSNRKIKVLEEFISSQVKNYYMFLGAPALVIMIGYPVLVKTVIGNPEFESAWLSVFILMTGFLLSSGFKPFDMFLNQVGFPGWQTILLVVTLSINIILNALLIPMFGIEGAALSTSIASFAAVIIFKSVVGHLTGVSFCFKINAYN